MNRLLEWVCGTLSGVALFCIMALTFFDVGGRKLVSTSIPGSLELTELLMVVVIFAALPLVSLRGEHVVFNSMDSYLAPDLQRLQRGVVHVLSALLLIGLAYLMWQTAGEFAQSGETTAQLKFTKAPFIYGMSVLCALTGCVHLGQLAKPTVQEPVEAAAL